MSEKRPKRDTPVGGEDLADLVLTEQHLRSIEDARRKAAARGDNTPPKKKERPTKVDKITAAGNTDLEEADRIVRQEELSKAVRDRLEEERRIAEKQDWDSHDSETEEGEGLANVA